MGELILDQQTRALVKRLPHAPGDRTFHYVTYDASDGELVFLGRMSEETYSEAISTLVLRCVDVIPYDAESESILIATRDNQPQAGDWVFGGRKIAGTSDGETAKENLKRELKIIIDPVSLLPSGYSFDMRWPTHQQRPFIGPSSLEFDGVQAYLAVHQSTALYILPIGRDQIDTTQVNEEYCDARWVDPFQIIDAEPGTFHPTLVDIVAVAIETITRPDDPTDIEQAYLRAVGQLATIKSAMRQRPA